MSLDEIPELHVGDAVEVKHKGKRRVEYFVKEFEKTICFIPSWEDVTSIDAINVRNLRIYLKDSLEDLEVVKRNTRKLPPYDKLLPIEEDYRSPNRSYNRKTFPWMPGGIIDEGDSHRGVRD